MNLRNQITLARLGCALKPGLTVESLREREIKFLRDGDSWRLGDDYKIEEISLDQAINEALQGQREEIEPKLRGLDINRIIFNARNDAELADSIVLEREVEILLGENGDQMLTDFLCAISRRPFSPGEEFGFGKVWINRPNSCYSMGKLSMEETLKLLTAALESGIIKCTGLEPMKFKLNLNENSYPKLKRIFPAVIA